MLLKNRYLATVYATAGLVVFILIVVLPIVRHLSWKTFSIESLRGAPWPWLIALFLAVIGLYASSLFLGANACSWIAKSSKAKSMAIGIFVAMFSVSAAVAAGGLAFFVPVALHILIPESFPASFGFSERTVWSVFVSSIGTPVLGFLLYGFIFWFPLGLVYGAHCWRALNEAKENGF